VVSSGHGYTMTIAADAPQATANISASIALETQPGEPK
jgi:hypothetical protein